MYTIYTIKNKYYFTMIFLYILFASFNFAYGMIAGYTYQEKDFINYANQFKESDAACAIVYPQGELSGVLIRDDLVITAAHGAVNMGPQSFQKNIVGFVTLKADNVYVIFNNSERVKVDSVYVDGRYLTEDKAEYGKYDIAFLKLEKPVKKHKPVPLSPKICLSKQTASFVVVCHGMSDHRSFLDSIIGRSYKRRAFALLEWSAFYVHMRSLGNVDFNRSLLYSSIFFDARKTYVENLPIDADNTDQRTMEALRLWYEADRPPYALALPGTSGSPIFLKNTDQSLTLIGLVVAYAPIRQNTIIKGDLHTYLLTNPKAAIGKFQTIFCLLYKENVLENTQTHVSFTLDPIVVKILSTL
ncbi:MAG: hypothetical protein NEHIOOID_00499 [Holosporales bacterium]